MTELNGTVSPRNEGSTLTVDELANSVESGGGVIKLVGDQLRWWVPAGVAHLSPEIQRRRADLVTLLRQRGGLIGGYLGFSPGCHETPCRTLTLEVMADILERGGGTAWLKGDTVDAFAPDSAHHLLNVLLIYEEDLRSILQSDELVERLKSSGGRLGYVFHCPKCASDRLHRPRIEANFKCLDCGLKEIDEQTARRNM